MHCVIAIRNPCLDHCLLRLGLYHGHLDSTLAPHKRLILAVTLASLTLPYPQPRQLTPTDGYAHATIRSAGTVISDTTSPAARRSARTTSPPNTRYPWRWRTRRASIAPSYNAILATNTFTQR